MPDSTILFAPGVTGREPPKASGIEVDIHVHSYATVITDKDKEFEFVVVVTHRQDSKVAWLVVLSQVDDTIHMINGINASNGIHKQLNSAIHYLTVASKWVVRLNQEWK